MAVTKHYIANEQERFRLKSEAVMNGVPISESTSANVDDKTMHELYLWYILPLPSFPWNPPSQQLQSVRRKG